jgi:MtN3 and saliva related transmembrane protein
MATDSVKTKFPSAKVGATSRPDFRDGAMDGTTCSFLPQVVKTRRSRSATDISLIMFSLFSVGVLIWLVYGLMIHAAPVIIANAITLALALAILIMKIRFKYDSEFRTAC